MKLIPEVKELIKGKKRKIDGCSFVFDGEIDKRIKNLCKKVPEGKTEVTISVTNGKPDAYTMEFSDGRIKITAEGQSGAFYAVQTLRQIIKNGYSDADEIKDSPDYETRGFYFDITRGRVPKLETLKKLVDWLSYCKINMLQLYVEHVFEFKEYDGIYQRTGYMTAEETKELDRYCYENFIELVPSLSCFGHLYELLQSDKYKHLCELDNYKPTSVAWNERMAHHTINPSDPESIEVIKSLIDQYSPLFTSKKFNICCDETFDLGNGKNKGKDKGRLYVDFVKKIIAHVKSKGKTPMMWGDIISNHSELISEFDDDVIFMSWRYDKDPDPTMVYKFRDAKRPHYVCSGVNNWSSLIEDICISNSNITKMAQYGKESGAIGFLNTCWGDHGHISPLYACMYGITFGAYRAWNVNCSDSNFDSAMDLLYYGSKGATKLVKKLSGAQSHYARYWYYALAIYSNEKFSSDTMYTCCDPDKFNKSFDECEEVIPYLMSQKWENDEARETLLNVAEGTECLLGILMSKSTGEKLGVNIKDVEEWLKKYTEIYLRESKMGELKEFVTVMYKLAEEYLK